MMWTMRGEWLSSRAEKADVLSRTPLLPPYTGWQSGRHFVVCSPHNSSSACYEWMSLRFWTPGSAVNAAPIVGLVLVAQHGCTDAESNQPLWTMHQYDGTCAKVPMQLIVTTTAPLELLHIDFIGIEMTMELDLPPNVVNVMVFCNHCMKYIIAYMTHDQTAKTIAKLLWQDTSWSLDPQPSSWAIEVPIWKAMSLKSCVSSWAYRRLGLDLTMLRPMEKLSEVTKCLSIW